MKFAICAVCLLAILFAVPGCAAPAVTPTSMATLAAPAVTPTSTATLATPAMSPQEAIALANQFYTLFMEKQDYPSAVAMFDDQMKTALPENKLKEARDSLPQRVGAFQSRAEAKPQERQEQYERIIIPLQFEKMAINMLVVVDTTTAKISGLFFQPGQDSHADKYQAPAYVDTSKFVEREVKFGAEPWTLPGILALPTGAGPFPAVALVHGSGPNDRDETLGPNKPFKDIAQGLASRGIAVLRYDKRTKVYGDQLAKITALTVKEEAVDDAAAAVDFLRTQPTIDPKHVFVLGHSLGGYLAPRIAQAQPNLAGLIVLAGPTRPMEDLILEQMHYILESDGSLSAQDQAQLSAIQQEVDAVKALTPQSTAPAVMGSPAAYWLDLKEYHPVQEAQRLTAPMLILQGERDYQVTMQDFQNWTEALSSRPNVQLKHYTDLNHLFISGSGRSTPDEYRTPGNVAAQVISDIAAWIQQQPK